MSVWVLSNRRRRLTTTRSYYWFSSDSFPCVIAPAYSTPAFSSSTHAACFRIFHSRIFSAHSAITFATRYFREVAQCWGLEIRKIKGTRKFRVYNKPKVERLTMIITMIMTWKIQKMLYSRCSAVHVGSRRDAVDNDARVSMVAYVAPPHQYDVTVIPANTHNELYIGLKSIQDNGPIS